ncbi:unnamed protein product [Meganyctiphanes norvegica]|uniref:C-type lectin domain-containing protein n=1 Tax=Meganyctiphanes norvegica TaxID=48144 RepID=A0AAV2SQ14_MEGNR
MLYLLTIAAAVLPFGLGCQPPSVDIGGDYCAAILHMSTGSWEVLENTCKAFGGHLAKVDNTDFLYYLIKHINDNGLTGHNYWVGGSDAAEEGTWVWMDGTPVKMGSPFWGYETAGGIQKPDQGDQGNCMILMEDYHFLAADHMCEDGNAGICGYD